MASYAPLFAHTEGWQWTPNLIGFDNLRAYGTPNYYVQKLFANNKGNKVLPVLYQNAPATDIKDKKVTLTVAANSLSVLRAR